MKENRLYTLLQSHRKIGITLFLIVAIFFGCFCFPFVNLTKILSDTFENSFEMENPFETDRFSTYALIYNDVQVEMNQTGDTTLMWPWILLMVGVGMIVLYAKVGSISKLEKK